MNRPRRRIVHAPVTVAQAQAIVAAASQNGYGDLFHTPTKEQIERLETGVRNLQDGIRDTLKR